MIIKQTEVASTERQAEENVFVSNLWTCQKTKMKPVFGYAMVNLAQVRWSLDPLTYIMSGIETEH